MKKNSLSTSRKIYIGIMKALMWISVLFTCALVLFLIIYVLFKGFPPHYLEIPHHKAQLPYR